MFETPFEPIAIVGQGCVLPGARSPRELWEVLAAGRSLVTDAPRGRWGIDPDLVAGTPGHCVDAAYSTRGGYVEDARIDLAGTHLAEDHLRALDPLVHWLVASGRDALADAGFAALDASHGARFGAIVGNLSFPTEAMARRAEAAFLDAQPASFLGGRARALAGVTASHAENRFMSGLPAHLLARALGLGAGAFCLDAACASSLYAIRLAAGWLHERRADVMLAGAVNRADSLFLHVGFSALTALSPTGTPRPFDRAADGLVPAEGAGLVALMRLADAVKAGKRILGVVRGVGLSNDGRAKSLLAPSDEGQARAIARAYVQAGIDPRRVSLVECHATGTPVGDRTELVSMQQVFGAARAAAVGRVRIGSLKSNFGHLITAAGVIGLQKVLGALAHDVIPPTIHCATPLELLGDASPFRLVREPSAWPAEDAPRVAGVSAFGFGGNNAHLVVEEWRASPPVSIPAPTPSPPSASASVAIVAMGARVGVGGSLRAFAEDVFASARAGDGRGVAREVAVAIDGLRVPPNDLKAALPQQLLMFAAAREATAALPDAALPRDRTGVIVGMGCDAAVTTPGIRWRAASWARAWNERATLGLSAAELAAWTRELRDRVGPPIDAPAVLGCMPNIPANRVNAQLDFRGASFTTSAEELSGVAALDVARSLLAAGELDAVVVGAVDLAVDLRHTEALAATLLEREAASETAPAPGDAAVALVLVREADATRLGLPVLATLEACALASAGAPLAEEVAQSFQLDVAASPRAAHHTLVTRLGHAHAASGLVGVAAGVVACATHALPGDARAGAAVPWLVDRAEARVVRVDVSALGGATGRVKLRAPDAPVHALTSFAASNEAPPRLVILAAGSRASLIGEARRATPRVASAEEAAHAPHRLAVVFRGGDAELRAKLDRAAALLEGASPSPADDGVFLGDDAAPRPRVDQIAAVYGGAASPYPGMGRELLVAYPAIARELQATIGDLATAAQRDWLYPHAGGAARPSAPTYLEQLLAASSFMQAHALFVRRVLGVRAGVAIGYSLGESNALLATGAWGDLGAMLADVSRSRLFRDDLAGRCEAARVFLRARGATREAEADAPWATVTVFAPLADVRAAIAREPLVFLTLVNTDDECVVAGVPAAVDRVVAALGCQAYPVPLAPVVHCEAVRSVADAYRALHTRAVVPPEGVAYYGHGRGGRYAISRDACGDALLAQALATVDFPRLVRQAYDDGARVFLDHGPRGLCAGWIGRILAGRPHVAVPLDVPARSSLLAAFHAAAALVAAGVEIDATRLAAGAPRPPRDAGSEGARVVRPAHDTLASLPAPPRAAPARMAPAPELPRVLTAPVFADASPSLPRSPSPSPTPSPSSSPWSVLAAHRAEVGATHRAFLDEQARVHARFLAHRRTLTDHLATLVGQGLSFEPRLASPSPALPPAPPAPLSLPLFDRAALIAAATGKLSSVLGPLFARQDGFTRQVRMPAPPLLFCDRVLRIDAEAGVLVPHTSIVTETDVAWDAWYLHEGRVPPGVLIEAGQADLLLISYMGVDFENRGERVYRLLGCDLTYGASLPRAGQTLHYDIHIDGFATHGATRIFFFHSDCRLGGPDGEVVLSVRNGQAGFFTDEELARSGGVLWSADDEARAREEVDALPMAKPPRLTMKRSFARRDLEALAAGDAYACYGEGFEIAQTQVCPPRIQGGRFLLLDRVSAYEPDGGPWGRGYLRAELELSPTSWFFEGHFKDDPCMPGTIMFQGCLQCLEVIVGAMGFTLTRDGHRFEPASGTAFPLRCRGQATPASQLLVYEVFVKSVVETPVPTVRADILVSVDGLRSLHCRDIELRLAVDFPTTRSPEPSPDASSRTRPVAFDQAALLAIALGKPSDALGPMYAPFDAGRRVPRMPGPPYHFMSRVARVDGPPIGEMRAGGTAVVDYDVPPDAWYFRESGTGHMPFAVLLEVALQPCGWLSSYVGSALTSPRDLFYRNLDGTGTVHAEVAPDVGTLTTTTTLTKVSRSGDMILHEFALELAAGARPIFTATTVFGFFPAAALEKQVGVGMSDAQQRAIAEPSDVASDLRALALAPEGRLTLPGPMLRMIDRVTGYWPAGGARGLGRVRTEKTVDLREWFFKAHFFQDPVQPGSLGLEAMIQAVQWWAIETRRDEGVSRPRFVALAPGHPMTWKYRGQVVPTNRLIVVDVEIMAAHGDVVHAVGSLWVDGRRIYEAKELTLRVVHAA